MHLGNLHCIFIDIRPMYVYIYACIYICIYIFLSLPMKSNVIRQILHRSEEEYECLLQNANALFDASFVLHVIKVSNNSLTVCMQF